MIVGPTASGKSQVAMHLAEKFGGEIIAADSRTIYRGMDIGTAKPTPAECARVQHHLIDIADPDEPFTVADFQSRAQACILDISARGKLPIMVGGTGLYVDSVLFNFGFQKPGDVKRREVLQKLSVEELQQLLYSQGIELPTNKKNPRHLIRKLETGNESPKSQTLRPNTLIVGIEVDREVLKQRIIHRTAAMFADGLESEARMLASKYGWSRALQTIGYQEFAPYFAGSGALEDVQEEIVRDTISYAKRQRTWFTRNKSIHWRSQQREVEDLITTFLSK